MYYAYLTSIVLQKVSGTGSAIAKLPNHCSCSFNLAHYSCSSLLRNAARNSGAGAMRYRRASLLSHCGCVVLLC